MKGFKLTSSNPQPAASSRYRNLTDPLLEYSDPNPDIHELFRDYDQEYFYSTLGSVTLEFSKRMTQCAGICYLRRGRVTIRLSEPLLRLRKRSDLVETLLHEMIHAYIFLEVKHAIREDHGPEFHKHMYRINALANTKITVYHTWHSEVESLKLHWWRCNGICRSRAPYYGYVKRSVNRAPSKHDSWHEAHRYFMLILALLKKIHLGYVTYIGLFMLSKDYEL